MYWQHIFIRCHIFCSFSHLAPSPMGFSKALSTSSASCSATSCSPRSLRAPRPPAASPCPTLACPPCSCPLPPDFASSLSLKLGLRPRFGLGSGIGLRPDCLEKFQFASFLLLLNISFTLAFSQPYTQLNPTNTSAKYPKTQKSPPPELLTLRPNLFSGLSQSRLVLPSPSVGE